ncbi:hypothetical protein [Bacillus sp. 165]|nr:hypothetical protein [Bacillus sp. 165]
MIHVLITDDDSHIRQLLKHYLETAGYIVHEAADGAESTSAWL